MTSRQEKILAAIVEQYAEVASPVGSSLLAKAFGVSSATIRSEMAELERLSYITQPHTSAGRVPTDKGYRYYVNALQAKVEKGEVSRAAYAIERRIKSAGEIDHAVKLAAESLSEITHNLGIGTLSDQTYFAGFAQLFGQPEFLSGKQVFEVARLLDSLDEWAREVSRHGNRVSVLIGAENPVGRSSGCSLIVGRFNSPYSDHSYVGILGPTRQNYGQVIGLVDHTSKALEEMLYA